MAVKIRLKRMGKIRAPFYRVVIMDSRTKRDGRAIEEIGKYHPTQEPSLIEINSERAQYWLGVGAQPTEQVAALLKITGDWQTFKGLPGTEGTLRVAEPKADKLALFEAASKSAMAEPKDGATTARKRKAEAEPKADKAEADKTEAEPKADKAEPKAKADKTEASAPAADGVAVEAPAVEAPVAEVVVAEVVEASDDAKAEA